jgi:hypothetical protein
MRQSAYRKWKWFGVKKMRQNKDREPFRSDSVGTERLSTPR